MDSTFLSNVVLLLLLFVISGIIIIKFLKKINMRIAKCLFTVLYFIMLLYIPLYLGAFATMNIIESTSSDSSVDILHYLQMKTTLNAPFQFVKLITIFTASLAIIIVAITIIITHITITCVVQWVNKILKKKDISTSVDKDVFSNASGCLLIPSTKRLYLRYCRFLI